jgi:hypothetical protein
MPICSPLVNKLFPSLWFFAGLRRLKTPALLLKPLKAKSLRQIASQAAALCPAALFAISAF